MLIEKPGRNGSGVSKLNVYSGRLGTRERERSSVHAWMTDGRGQLRLRFLVGKRDYRWQYRRSGEKKWHVLREWDHEDIDVSYQPVGFGNDPDLLLVLKPHEGRIALWSEDLAADRSSKLVFARSDVDVGGSLRLGKYHRMVAVGYSTDRNHLHYFDERVEEITKKISAVFPGQEVMVAGESWDRRYYLVQVRGDRNPGTYYRFDASENQLGLITAQYPRVEGLELSAMEPMRYTARDGTSISGYLSFIFAKRSSQYGMV